MPQEYFAKGRAPSNPRGNSLERNPSQNSSLSSSDEDADLFSIIHQFKFTCTEPEELTLDDCLASKDAGLTRVRESIFLDPAAVDSGDLGDFLSALENLDLKSIKATRPSRLSMALVDDPQDDDQPLSRLAPTKKENTSSADDAKLEAAKKKLQTANLKKVTTRLYLENASNSQSVQLTSLSTPELVIEGLIESGKLAENVEWVMTEIHETFGVSRALKPWEPILDIIEPWETECPNALLIKARQGEILTPEVSRESPFMKGWLQVELRKGKWEKKYAVLKRATLYLGKSEAMAGASALCTMQNFEAFSSTRHRSKAPKRPLFALKSQQSIMLFEKPDEDYIHFLACDTAASRDEWIRALRHSRSWAQYSAFVARSTPFSPFSDDSLLRDNISGLQIDKGQFEELDIPKLHGNSSLSKGNAGGIAGRLFRLVLTGDPGKTNIDRVVGSRALPDVFAEGSLLSKPVKSEEPEPAPSSVEEEVFKEGSLLSRGASSRGAAPKESSPTATEFQANSLLNSHKPRHAKPQPLSIPAKSGPLLQLQPKDADMFQNGTLLNSPQSQYPASPRAQYSLQSPSNHRNASPTSPGYDALTRSPSAPSRQRPQRSPTGPLLGSGAQYARAYHSGSLLSNSEDDIPLKANTRSLRKPPTSSISTSRTPSSGASGMARASSSGSSRMARGPSSGLSKEPFSQGSLLSKPTRRDTAPSGPLLQLPGKPEQNHTSQIKKQNLKPLISFK